MENCWFHHASFSLYTIVHNICLLCNYNFLMSFSYCGMVTFMVVSYWHSIIWSMIVCLNSHSIYFLVDHYFNAYCFKLCHLAPLFISKFWIHFKIQNMIFLDIGKSLSLNTLIYFLMWKVPITYAYTKLFVHYCLCFAIQL